VRICSKLFREKSRKRSRAQSLKLKGRRPKKIAESKVIPLEKRRLKMQVEAVVAVVEGVAVVDRVEVLAEAVEEGALAPTRLWRRPQHPKRKMVRVVAASAEGSAIATQCRTCVMG
jgi:hypothetical protein